MPIYEYECQKCGVTFEMMQPVSAKPLKNCQGLGCDNRDNGKVNRIVSASGFILKGTGWYSSDYPSESRKKGWEQEQKQANPVSAEQSSTTGGESKKAPAAEASPAPKSEPKPATKAANKNPFTRSKGKKAKASK